MQGVVLLIGGAIALLFVALILWGLAYAWPIGVMLILIIVIPILSYPMAIALWFMTNHIAFWPGFKELIWALFPLINITYVWEWWLPILIWVWEVARAYWSLL
jgi:hypothetical protein